MEGNKGVRRGLAVRATDWLDERLAIREPMHDILNHPVPRHARAMHFCLGGSPSSCSWCRR